MSAKTSNASPSGTISTATLLDRVEAAAPFEKKLVEAAAAIVSRPVCFDHVAAAAQGFLVALLTRRLASGGRAWIVCDHLRDQERLSNELSLWLGGALFFPEEERLQFEGAVPDPEINAERLSILQRLATAKPDPGTAPGDPIVISAASLDERVPVAGALAESRRVFRAGDQLDLDSLREDLTAAGFEAVTQVTARGQFSVRGGITDIFSWQSLYPFRIELFDDEIESLREFDVDAQTSVGRRDEVTLLLAAAATGESDDETATVPLRDYIDSKTDLVIGVECDVAPARIQITADAVEVLDEEDFSCACFDNPLGGFEAGDFILQDAKRRAFDEQVAEWEKSGWHVTMVFNGEGERERFGELVDTPFLKTGFIQVLIGDLDRGFEIPGARLAVISDAEIFGRYHRSRARRAFQRDRRKRTSATQTDFREFDEDDLVVHSDYGIGRFLGLERKPDAVGEDAEGEVLVIEFADEAKLYVPLDQAHLISRYVGLGRKAPKLSQLGGKRWSRMRQNVERSILDYAAHMLGMQAERDSKRGHAHPPDTRWQWEFENSFPYKETPDQITSIADTKADMESPRPMDRLICGDVGFGKTEVAIRAAFKAVMGGKQVAILVPTTVLAQQHFQNFRERMSEYPVTIELLSRFRTRAEQNDVVKRLAEGSVDIVIGTHRLISKDISFKNLGLVVIDEEQRFGVKHKERFKELFLLVDVLTLSATPIPRTLYFSLMGARDMSTIETPPPNRYPVQTTICPYDQRIIRDAIKKELERDGQVFFLHNRVQGIERVRETLEDLVPEGRFAVGHGQMHEDELEEVMARFIEGDFDVLVCTTIIESGIDIPNANTIVIDRADRFGLADLYQLRGRVGRAQHKAYAFLMLPRDMMSTGDARKRINAIKQYSSLGAGFKIAMRDLEIRGAGNLLGTQQSGHIVAIGFDLYCQLLKQSIAKLKGEAEVRRLEVALKIDFVSTNEAEYLQAPEERLPCFIPMSFVEDTRLRIQAYRQVAETMTLAELEQLEKDWRDRFGTFPPAVAHLLVVTELRVRLGMAGIAACEIKEGKLMLTRNGDLILIDRKFPRLPGESPAGDLEAAVKLVKGY